MAKDNSDFFDKKDNHPWSKTKDSLLGCYLKPFFDKTYHASRDGYVYVDAFAGPGKYLDGGDGSPLIAIRRLRATASKNRIKRPIKFIFGESNSSYRVTLAGAAKDAAGSGRYILPVQICDSSSEALQAAQLAQPKLGMKPSTIFYYVDPYGVKDIRLSALCKSPNPAHTEALVNFNTIGFMRDGYEALRIAMDLPSGVKVIDQGFDDQVPLTERILRLNNSIGCDDWQIILKDKTTGYWEKEMKIAELFCANAHSFYRYVTNMPIRDVNHKISEGGEIKYRLIHMTNSPDGCILMNDNMLKRNTDEQVLQAQLLKVDVDLRDVNPAKIHDDMEYLISSMPKGQTARMSIFAAMIIDKYGVFDRATVLLRTYLKPFLDNGVLIRKRPLTKTGKPCNSFDSKDVVIKT